MAIRQMGRVPLWFGIESERQAKVQNRINLRSMRNRNELGSWTGWDEGHLEPACPPLLRTCQFEFLTHESLEVLCDRWFIDQPDRIHRPAKVL